MTNQKLDTCLELIRDGDRRQIIQNLRRESHDETTIEALLEQLSGSESVQGIDPPPDRDVLLAKLHHNHLPKLAEHGVVDFDPAKGTVRYRSPDRIESVLDALPEGPSTPVPSL